MHPARNDLDQSQRVLLAQNALSSALFSIGTGNFLAGFLTYLGASPAYCAVVGAMPQFGCILQLVSPFLFERLRHRKAAICVCCFVFRFGMGLAGLIPFLLTGKNARLGAVFVLYLLAFLMAGFVTPGLDQWKMELAPEVRRGQFFAVKNILGTLVNAMVSLALGYELDWFADRGNAGMGYLVLYICCCLFACLDLFLMSRMREIPCIPMEKMKLADLGRPLRDKTYRKIILFLMTWFFAVAVPNSFLSVYMIQGLGMSQAVITWVTTVASFTGILGTWLWGQIADRSSWNRVMLLTGCVIGGAYLCWFAVGRGTSVVVPLFLQAAITTCNGSFQIASANMQYGCAPGEGKTLYLGVGAAMANLSGYGATLLAASVQSCLERQIGIQSINVLFACSGVCCLASVLLIVPKLPKVSQGKE